MKKHLLLWTASVVLLCAQDITFSPEQEKNWQIKLAIPTVSKKLPLGNFVAQVVTPPSLLHTVSLPFEANVKQLYVAKYQRVQKGDVLAMVTGTEWIAIQQTAISQAIEYKHHKHLTERKNMLCQEEIIPQKECMAANAELKADKIRVASSKALLKSYGASTQMIETLFRSLELSPTTKIKSIAAGRIIILNATPGKSTSPSEALFVIQAKGDLWLESNMEAQSIKSLSEGQKVNISFNGSTFETTVLQISPVINPENQSRLVRFLLPEKMNMVSGLRSTAGIYMKKPSLQIKKTSVIKNGLDQIVFVKTDKGYTSLAIDILAQDDDFYYVKKDPKLNGKIAVSSLAILKNMLGEDNE